MTCFVTARDPKPGESVPFTKHASAAVYDVPSVSSAGKSLGSVCYSDTFVDFSVTVAESGLYMCVSLAHTFFTVQFLSEKNLQAK